MLSIRLSRFGKKKQPSYRVVICQKHKDPLGDYIENIGHINYYGGQKNVTLDLERAKYWISVGAQPTGTVHNLLVEKGVIEAKKKRPYGTRKVVKKEAPAEENKEEIKPEEVKKDVKDDKPEVIEEKKEPAKEDAK